MVARLNRITNPSRLRIGSTLLVPLRMLRFFVGTAEVVWVRGAVTAVTAAGESRVIAAGARVETGSRIETGPDSAVRVRLVDGALLLVGERSRVSVDELTVFALPGVVRTKLGVGQGRVEAQVNRQRPGSRYEIRTPVMTTAVRGTEFRVGMLDEGRGARTEVMSGGVDAATGTSSVAVEAGLGLVVAADGSLGAPRPLPSAPDLSALPARLERLPVQLAWPPVAARAATAYSCLRRWRERPLVAERVTEAATARWPDLADGRYTVRIRAIENTGLEGHDAEASIEVKARPQPPFASEPVDGGRVYGARPALRWTRAEGARATTCRSRRARSSVGWSWIRRRGGTSASPALARTLFLARGVAAAVRRAWSLRGRAVVHAAQGSRRPQR